MNGVKWETSELTNKELIHCVQEGTAKILGFVWSVGLLAVVCFTWHFGVAFALVSH